MLSVLGVGEVPISTSGVHDGRPLHTIRAVGAVSRALCARQPGDIVGVRGPFGTAWPLDLARGGDLVIVAGGIGLAPLRPAVREALATRGDYGALSLLVGARTPGDLLYTGELEQLAASGAIEIAVTVDAAPGGWQGRVGVVPRLVPTASFDAERCLAFVCGPEIMIRFTTAALRDRGVPRERIYISTERNMQCGVGHCGHCQLGPYLVCRDGPVFRLDQVEDLLAVREL